MLHGFMNEDRISYSGRYLDVNELFSESSSYH